MSKRSPWTYLKRIFSSESGRLTMAHTGRYFTNTMADYNGTLVTVAPGELKNRIVEISNNIIAKLSLSAENCDGGLYVGLAGVAYTMYYLSKSPLFNTQEKAEFMNHALEYLKPSLDYCKGRENSRNDASAFVLGNAGVYAVAGAVFSAAGDADKAEYYRKMYEGVADNCRTLNFLRCGSDELFVGRAGYLAGAVWLARELGRDAVPSATLHALCETVIASGESYAKKKGCAVPLMFAYYNVDYLGAAHGLCAILQVLMTVPQFLQTHPVEAGLVKRSVDALLDCQTRTGNFPCTLEEVCMTEEPQRDELVHWCHGAPGVVLTMARAYVLWKDDKYLDACLRCGDLVWRLGLLRKGPGICHGVAGNAYVFLLLYRLTKDPKHLHRAVRFAEFLKTPEFQRDARTPDSPYSLYEGWAGTACFLADLAHPQNAAFPFQDVF